MAKRKNPGYKLKVKLLQEVQFICPFCGYSQAENLHHHHIDEGSSNTVFNNMISVCPNCHTKIGSGEISRKQVQVL